MTGILQLVFVYPILIIQFAFLCFCLYKFVLIHACLCQDLSACVCFFFCLPSFRLLYALYTNINPNFTGCYVWAGRHDRSDIQRHPLLSSRLELVFYVSRLFVRVEKASANSLSKSPEYLKQHPDWTTHRLTQVYGNRSVQSLDLCCRVSILYFLSFQNYMAVKHKPV